MKMDDEENDSLCERILWDLNNIFKKDSKILEFDIIDVIESRCNKSPVIYTDHHLALEKWCVTHLYEYAYKKLLNFKKQNNRTEFDLLHQWTRIILLLNPDFTTAWNLRRNFLIKSVRSHLEDIQFTELVLIRKPKCASVFSYREWLLNNYLIITKELNEDLILNELRITLEAADRYSRNYYAWSHRTWILTVYIKNSTNDYILNKIIQDLSITEKWLEKHISDYSCFQHRQFLFHFIHKLETINANSEKLNSSSCQSQMVKCRELFFREFQWLDCLWRIYPEQESLFLHRRFLLHTAYIRYPNKINQLKEEENQFYQKTLRMSLSESSLRSWQNELIRRYLLYLKRNLNWTFEA